MSIIWLSQEERNKFASYLDQEAESDDGIAKQIEGLPSKPVELAKKYRTEAMASRIIANKLRSMEATPYPS